MKIADCYIFGINSAYSGLTKDNRKCDYYYNPIISATTLNVSGGSTVLNEKISQGLISDFYSATTEAKIYDYNSGTTYSENPENGGKNEEPAANSVINVKNIEIKFIDTPKNQSGETVSTDLTECWQTYITDVVMNYVEQMLPSTTIFKWWFTSDLNNNDGPETKPVTKYLKFKPKDRHVDADATSTFTTIDTNYASTEYTITDPIEE